MINVGLDFGTHQTKVCIEKGFDVNNMSYSFLSFDDGKGNRQYVLPSVIQLNKDNTLSYGFVDETKCKLGRKRNVPDFTEELPVSPTLDLPEKPKPKEIDIKNVGTALELAYLKAQSASLSKEQYQKDLEEWQRTCESLRADYEEKKRLYDAELFVYNKKRQIWEEQKQASDGKIMFRNFKQATFIPDYNWTYEIPPQVLSVWYLAFVIFQLNSSVDEDFSIHVGVPTGCQDLKQRQRLAVQLIISAYKLVEETFAKDEKAFLGATLEELQSCTQLYEFEGDEHYKNQKYYYNISVFPEALAGIFVLTAQNKLPRGFNLLIDIGGGTTDISFFAVNSVSSMPLIYDYSSVPMGLNFLVESSMPDGWDRMSSRPSLDSPELDTSKLSKARKILIDRIAQTCKAFLNSLYKERSHYSLSKNQLNSHLFNRPVVYFGGGSTYENLRQSVLEYFTDVHFLDSKYWNGLFVDDMEPVTKAGFCPILSVALGLAITNGKESDENIETYLKNLPEIFDSFKGSKEEYFDHGKDKDLQDL